MVVKMTKYEFLGDLSRLLSQLSDEERDEAIKFYEDYFDEAGKEKEAEVIEELGSPQEVARKILQENEEEIPVSEAKREEGKEVEPYIHIQTKKESDYDSESGNRKENRWKDWDRNKILLIILLLIIQFPQ